MNLFSKFCKLTTAMSCDPTPLSISHASTSVVSLQDVSWITTVGHCGTKGCTRAPSLTICRSFGGRTTADSCREDRGTTLLVAIMQVHEIQHRMHTDIKSAHAQSCKRIIVY